MEIWEIYNMNYDVQVSFITIMSDIVDTPENKQPSTPINNPNILYFQFIFSNHDSRFWDSNLSTDEHTNTHPNNQPSTPINNP